MLIGLYLRHIKAYKGINYIPVGFQHNFVSYLGENGSGKSSILEALNSFFNKKEYSINKSALSDGTRTKGNFPYITPIFLIEKSKITKSKSEFETLSNFYWTVEKKILAPNAQKFTNDFFALRDLLLKTKKYNSNSHYLILIGENINDKYVYFHSFQKEEKFLDACIDTTETEDFDPDNELNKKYKGVLSQLKDLYSYVYVPVEIDAEDFTKIETDNMQKIFGKTLKNEILEALDNDFIDKINDKLNSFVSEIETTLNGEYFYDSEKGGTSKKYLKNYDLFEKILEVYFKIRVLNKGSSNKRTLAKKISELSAGEKRQALINLIYAFLIKNEERDNMVIIGIDEPENSLHTSLCYDQFEKLKDISEHNQILITTHWYGFLPIVDKGMGHFLYKNVTDSEKEADTKSNIDFETYDLYSYKADIKCDIVSSQNKMPKDFTLKSTNDLVQSIFYSLQGDDSYNWLICEGISEKIYFEYFFKNEIDAQKLRILPLGGNNPVAQFYEYLALPVKNEKETLKGKIFCLIDTDSERFKDDIGDGPSNLKIRRLCNESNAKTDLILLSSNKTTVTTIENSLNPLIFKCVLDNLNDNQNYAIQKVNNETGNTDFVFNFENYHLSEFFNENDGNNKILFARKYVEMMQQQTYAENFFPAWVAEIKTFFNPLNVLTSKNNSQKELIKT